MMNSKCDGKSLPGQDVSAEEEREMDINVVDNSYESDQLLLRSAKEPRSNLLENQRADYNDTMGAVDGGEAGVSGFFCDREKGGGGRSKNSPEHQSLNKESDPTSLTGTSGIHLNKEIKIEPEDPNDNTSSVPVENPNHLNDTAGNECERSCASPRDLRLSNEIKREDEDPNDFPSISPTKKNLKLKRNRTKKKSSTLAANSVGRPRKRSKLDVEDGVLHYEYTYEEMPKPVPTKDNPLIRYDPDDDFEKHPSFSRNLASMLKSGVPVSWHCLVQVGGPRVESEAQTDLDFFDAFLSRNEEEIKDRCPHGLMPIQAHQGIMVALAEHCKILHEKVESAEKYRKHLEEFSQEMKKILAKYKDEHVQYRSDMVRLLKKRHNIFRWSRIRSIAALRRMKRLCLGHKMQVNQYHKIKKVQFKRIRAFRQLAEEQNSFMGRRLEKMRKLLDGYQQRILEEETTRCRACDKWMKESDSFKKMYNDVTETRRELLSLNEEYAKKLSEKKAKFKACHEENIRLRKSLEQARFEASSYGSANEKLNQQLAEALKKIKELESKCADANSNLLFAGSPDGWKRPECSSSRFSRVNPLQADQRHDDRNLGNYKISKEKTKANHMRIGPRTPSESPGTPNAPHVNDVSKKNLGSNHARPADPYSRSNSISASDKSRAEIERRRRCEVSVRSVSSAAQSSKPVAPIYSDEVHRRSSVDSERSRARLTADTDMSQFVEPLEEDDSIVEYKPSMKVCRRPGVSTHLSQHPYTYNNEMEGNRRLTAETHYDERPGPSSRRLPYAETGFFAGQNPWNSRVAPTYVQAVNHYHTPVVEPDYRRWPSSPKYENEYQPSSPLYDYQPSSPIYDYQPSSPIYDYQPSSPLCDYYPSSPQYHYHTSSPQYRYHPSLPNYSDVPNSTVYRPVSSSLNPSRRAPQPPSYSRPSYGQ